ncbi:MULTISPECIES: hypothetical protein [unclassified Moorena]|nr:MULTISPECIES: hypothetical protein [unclassified Moorena]NEO22672.1 hypothetical protein [Moorena sp. SIO4A5]NEP29421.1 hypothetical protein [Moorena sp. SIO3I6]NEQ61417.1 hypothetical protein [Moorena sp. SIO4A1]
MRYTELFDYWLLPLLSYLLPAPCSLLPKTQIFVPHKSYNCYINYLSF